MHTLLWHTPNFGLATLSGALHRTSHTDSEVNCTIRTESSMPPAHTPHIYRIEAYTRFQTDSARNIFRTYFARARVGVVVDVDVVGLGTGVCGVDACCLRSLAHSTLFYPLSARARFACRDGAVVHTHTRRMMPAPYIGAYIFPHSHTSIRSSRIMYDCGTQTSACRWRNANAICETLNGLRDDSFVFVVLLSRAPAP